MPLTREQRQNIAARPTQRLRLVLCRTDDRFRFVLLSESRRSGRTKRSVDTVSLGCGNAPEVFTSKREAVATARRFGYQVGADGFLIR